MISKETIDKIFSSSRVEEVISDFVNLKKAGSNYKGLSPFVDEKSPSFMVSPSKQIWKDFSSGKGGNVVTFIMEHEQFTYPEALRYLARKYNIEIDEGEETFEQKELKLNKDSLYQISEVANDYFQNQLWNTEEGNNIGLSYFKERGFTDEIIKKFQLGFSPRNKEAFSQFASNKGYKQEVLTKSGLSILRDDGSMLDRFRERVIFPIHSFSGRVLGFGGRILQSNAKTAKYLNSPESEIYHKSQILYGLFYSKSTIIKEDNCLLVEGYTDVISLFQNGIENVVASSGTALTTEQIRLIKRLTNNVTVIYDGDKAGIKASFRGIDMFLEQELNVRVLLLPEGEDPDSFARSNSKENTKNFIKENTTDFIQFKTNVLLKEVGDDPIKKAGLIVDIIKSISLVKSKIQQEIYLKECSKLLDISENVLFKELAQILNKQQTKENYNYKEKPIVLVKNDKKPLEDSASIIEKKLLDLMLNYGDNIVILSYNENEEPYETSIIEEIIFQLNENEIYFKNDFYKQIYDEISEGLDKEELRSGGYFLQHENQDYNEFVANSMMDKYVLSENWGNHDIFIEDKETKLNQEVKETILRYQNLRIKDIIKNLESEINSENRDELLVKITKLTMLRHKFNEMLNRVL